MQSKQSNLYIDTTIVTIYYFGLFIFIYLFSVIVKAIGMESLYLFFEIMVVRGLVSHGIIRYHSYG